MILCVAPSPAWDVTYHVDQLIPFVDHRYRTVARRAVPLGLTAPLQSATKARAGSAQRSGAGMYALLAVLAVAIVGGGGAYMGGLFDSSAGADIADNDLLVGMQVFRNDLQDG